MTPVFQVNEGSRHFEPFAGAKILTEYKLNIDLLPWYREKKKKYCKTCDNTTEITEIRKYIEKTFLSGFHEIVCFHAIAYFLKEYN